MTRKINFCFILVDTQEEHRCMVRLMKMSLGLNEQTAEAFLSPTKAQPTSLHAANDYEDVEEVYI